MAENSNSEAQNVAVNNSTMNGESTLSSLSVEEVDSMKKEANLLFLQGKRSVFIRDYQAAVAALSKSCQMLSQIYPELDDALSGPYYYYGKALLEVGRSESEVLGDQMQESDGDDNDEEEEEEEDNKANEETEKEEFQEKPEDSTLDTKTEANENEDSSEPLNNGEKAGTSADENKTDKENADDANGDIDDLQLSWEYLELAKLIYLKKADSCKETAIKLAETYLCLGENGLESGNYPVAIDDIRQALELQQKHLSPEDRRIAETYYQLGIAHSLAQSYDEAVNSFKNAVSQLEKKIASLETRKRIGDKKTPEEEKDAFYTMDGEINEIKEVIKDIEEKIKDMMDCKSQMKAELLKQVTSIGNQPGACSSGDTTTNTAPTKPATDISHLVRKKRKNDEEEANQEKRTRTEN